MNFEQIWADFFNRMRDKLLPQDIAEKYRNRLINFSFG